MDGIKEACGSIHSVGYVCEESWHRPTGLLTVIEIRYVDVASSITTAVVKPKKTRNTEEIFRSQFSFHNVTLFDIEVFRNVMSIQNSGILNLTCTTEGYIKLKLLNHIR